MQALVMRPAKPLHTQWIGMVGVMGFGICAADRAGFGPNYPTSDRGSGRNMRPIGKRVSFPPCLLRIARLCRLRDLMGFGRLTIRVGQGVFHDVPYGCRNGSETLFFGLIRAAKYRAAARNAWVAAFIRR